MKFTDKLARAAASAGSVCASVIKICILSRKPSPPGNADASAEIVILGNGPSLAQTIERNKTWLTDKSLMAVNFAANTPQWRALEPEYYILADPHFFIGDDDPNVEKLWDSLRLASWRITLFVPVEYAKTAERKLSGGKVEVKKFNLTPVEGPQWISNRVYRRGLGMPRPRNVLIPAIMTAIREGFKTIYLCGADHSWTRTLSVDDDNRVVSIQPHFYEDNDAEHQRVSAVYSGVKLHEMLQSLTIAFRSYFMIEAYAARSGVKILNATPESFIDAFPRYIPPLG